MLYLFGRGFYLPCSSVQIVTAHCKFDSETHLPHFTVFPPDVGDCWIPSTPREKEIIPLGRFSPCWQRPRQDVGAECSVQCDVCVLAAISKLR